MARSRLLCCFGVVLGLLQPLSAFRGGALPALPRVRPPCTVCSLRNDASTTDRHPPAANLDQAVRRTPRGVDEGRRNFVVGSSLAAGSLLARPSFAEVAEDIDEDLLVDIPPLLVDILSDEVAWAVDIEVPAYAENKAWMWKDLQDGNIVKADTKLAVEDIFYPKWMLGLWKVESTTRCVEAPLGEELFGRGGALEAAQKDIGQPLNYQARFRKATGGRVVADRAFNVNSISQAAMGEAAVLECFLEDGNANQLKMTLVPSGAGGRVFDALLYVTSRDQTRVSEAVESFGCSETSHQTVVAQNGPIKGNVGAGSVSIARKATMSVKDIQVIQVFQRENAKEPEPTSFASVQRISTFMTEDEFREKLRAKKFQGPGTAQKFSEIKKTPIDVRVYDITYTLIRRPRGGAAATLADIQRKSPPSSVAEQLRRYDALQ